MAVVVAVVVMEEGVVVVEWWWFVTSNTSLRILGTPTDFLTEHPSEWNNKESFQQSLKVIKSSRITNDNA